jgi:hypothetical protein
MQEIGQMIRERREVVEGEEEKRGEESVATQGHEMFTTSVLDKKKKKKGPPDSGTYRWAFVCR